MDKLVFVICLMVVLLLGSHMAYANTSMVDDSLVLPMPNGLSMEFVPVCVNTNSGLYDWKKIKLGDPTGGFKEYPTTVALGGSFPLVNEGKKRWCYYMAKYELSQKQYASLMTLKQPIKQSRKTYPVTGISWFDALEFANLYNQWIFNNAKETMPKFDTSYGFVRLPTEVEWEFAARGGSTVSADVFDQKIPYPPNKIQKYEWFGGPTSSHYKLKGIGLLKPNALGLHDMLGNADEMTMSLFSVEYYQGRTGGFVIKGNNYTTAKNTLRSSYRTEQPFYRSDKKGIFKPHTKQTLGFRLVISALVFPSRKIQNEMSNEWETYRSEMGASTPAALSTSATSVKVAAGSEDAFDLINRLKKTLREKGVFDSEIESKLGYLNGAVQDMEKTLIESEDVSAYLWVKNATLQAKYIRDEDQKLPILDTLISMAEDDNNTEEVAILTTRKDEHITNIKTSLTTYTQSIEQINTYSASAIKKGIVKHKEFLKHYGDNVQKKMLNRVEEHIEDYAINKRSKNDKWKKDILF